MSVTATPKKRDCSKEKDFDPLANKSKQICLPIEPDDYQRILFDAHAFRIELDDLMDEFPELFPGTIKQGYKLHDILPESKKMPDIRLRRIKVVVSDSPLKEEVFTIRPSFVMPYMTG
ncbi:MAG TPA: hypothetical protein ENK06_05660 [Gammaproteobacteria bacterium]|nr:hypothetical protein [Gammaproteobacteria bacterium]